MNEHTVRNQSHFFKQGDGRGVSNSGSIHTGSLVTESDEKSPAINNAFNTGVNYCANEFGDDQVPRLNADRDSPSNIQSPHTIPFSTHSDASLATDPEFDDDHLNMQVQNNNRMQSSQSQRRHAQNQDGDRNDRDRQRGIITRVDSFTPNVQQNIIQQQQSPQMNDHYIMEEDIDGFEDEGVEAAGQSVQEMQLQKEEPVNEIANLSARLGTEGLGKDVTENTVTKKQIEPQDRTAVPNLEQMKNETKSPETQTVDVKAPNAKNAKKSGFFSRFSRQKDQSKSKSASAPKKRNSQETVGAGDKQKDNEFKQQQQRVSGLDAQSRTTDVQTTNDNSASEQRISYESNELLNTDSSGSRINTTGDRQSSGQNLSGLRYLTSNAQMTTLQEIQEEQSSGIEPGSFHLKDDNRDFDVRKQNLSIQKYNRQEPRSPQQTKSNIRLEKQKTKKGGLQKQQTKFDQNLPNEHKCKDKFCKNPAHRVQLKCRINQLKVQQPLDLHTALKTIKNHLKGQYDDDIDLQAEHKYDPLVLKMHQDKYNKYCQQQRGLNLVDEWDFQLIAQKIRDEPIKCVKYNYALDSDIQNYLQYESLITISDDGKTLIINNKKPVDDTNYILESDPKVIKLQQQQYHRQVNEYKKSIRKIKKKLTKEQNEFANLEILQKFQDYKLAQPASDCSSSSCDDHDLDDLDDHHCHDHVQQQLIDQEIERLQSAYQLKQSTASCDLADIQGILYGGQSSRFWLYRKHFLSLDYQKLKCDTKKKPKDRRTKFPFYAWQCVTIQLQGRMVDLVIKNEDKMNLFLKLLIVSTHTLDGVKNSANGLSNALFEESVKKRSIQIRRERRGHNLSKNNHAIVPAKEKVEIRRKHLSQIYRQTFFKYRLMRIRIKIGFHAYQSRQTINEMIISQILASYEELTYIGLIQPVANYSQKSMETFNDILTGDVSQCINKLIALNHDPVVLQRKHMLYKKKELRILGFDHIDQMPNEKMKLALDKLVANNVSLLMNKQDQEKLKQQSLQTLQNHKDGIRKKLMNEQWAEDSCDDHKKHNVDRFSKGFGLFDNSSCHDLFQNVKINGKPMYLNRDVGTKLRFKFNKRVLHEELLKIKFILGVGGLNDLFFIIAILKKYDIVKKKFVLDLEEGQEVFIPQDLTCDAYPRSFRYYDPIIQITNQGLSKHSRQYYAQKTEFKLNKLKNADWQRDLLIKIGLIDTEENRKLTHKHAILNQKEETEIQYTDTPHPMSLQKSRYLLIDCTEQNLKSLAKMQVEQMHKREHYDHTDVYQDQLRSIEDKPLNFRFCHIDEVNENQLMNISFKQAYYQTMDSIKNQGIKIFTVAKMHTFVEENIDEIYEKRPRPEKEALILKNAKNLKPPYSQSTKILDIECIPEEYRTQRQNAIIFREKRIYANKILSDFERIVKNRKIDKRITMLAETKRDCDKKVDYQTKNDFLEERIEFTQRYFSYINDFSHNNQQMQKIRHQMFRINRKLKLQSKIKHKGRDPMDVLKGFMHDPETCDGHEFKLQRTGGRLIRDDEKKLHQIKMKEKQELMQSFNKNTDMKKAKRKSTASQKK